MSLVQRSVRSIAWNSGANIFRVVILLIRSVLLARWLPVDVFGSYTFAVSLISITALFADFGLGGAFLHRSDATSDELVGAAQHFTLTLLFSSIWLVAMMGGILIFSDGEYRLALIVLTLTSAGMQLIKTPRLILTRRVMHRRLVITQIVNLLIITAVALYLAWRGADLWALLSTNIMGLVLGIIAWYGWRPVWKPKLVWSKSAVLYFLRFGSRNFIVNLLSQLLDRVDDIWTGIFLGQTSLGFYSRAYVFATYPRITLARPINAVTVGTYAELKGERQRLSQAFFRINALLIRSGFLFAGLLALVAPELISLLLGDKWLPMLPVFRLMLLYTLLDPIRLTVANLFIAVGKPEQVVQARILQLIVLGVGLLVWGWKIEGVAVAVDLMLFLGIVLLLWRARAFVDYSSRQLFLVPALALALGLVAAFTSVMALESFVLTEWMVGGIKGILFTAVYSCILLLLERQELTRMIAFVSHHLTAQKEN